MEVDERSRVKIRKYNFTFVELTRESFSGTSCGIETRVCVGCIRLAAFERLFETMFAFVYRCVDRTSCGSSFYIDYCSTIVGYKSYSLVYLLSRDSNASLSSPSAFAARLVCEVPYRVPTYPNLPVCGISGPCGDWGGRLADGVGASEWRGMRMGRRKRGEGRSLRIAIAQPLLGARFVIGAPPHYFSAVCRVFAPPPLPPLLPR